MLPVDMFYKFYKMFGLYNLVFKQDIKSNNSAEKQAWDKHLMETVCITM